MAKGSPAKSANFGFLKHLDASLVALGAQAELLFTLDPVACLMRLRLLGERLARELAAHAGLATSPGDGQLQLLNDLRARGLLHPDVADIFHGLRRAGNRAAHEGAGSDGDALHQLKMARRLGIAVLRTLGKLPAGFKAAPFVPPAAPHDASSELRAEIEALRAEAQGAADARAQALEAAEFERQLREDYEQKVATLEEKLKATEAYADEQAAFYEERLAEVQKVEVQKPAADQQADLERLVTQAADAGTQLDLTEAETRALIDRQLRDAGWEADTASLRYGRGVRPQKGRNVAIAEWPTENGPADYALFAGLQLIGIVEAKRASRNVAASLEQSKRYARGLVSAGGKTWGEFAVPFLFATNGRPYLRQLVEESGIWFLDVRRPQNHPRALDGWYSPEGLSKLLDQDVDEAHAKLAADPVEALGLRYYQENAIRAVERAVEEGRREMLLAMATGTGKTRTCIGLVYRLLSAQRFNRILFVVDRSALGEQAKGAFEETKVDGIKTFAETFNLKGLGAAEPESATKLHIATIQAMVKRVLYSDEDVPTIDTYDCIVVDECHRGYLLDREMSDAELHFRDEADYISKYRRVLEHFDAVKIGLTATPALHTRDIFGDPVFSYSYPEAVIDGYLVDHEPPVRIVTALAEDGIHWKVGEEVTAYSPRTRKEQLWLLPDEVKIDLEGFNRRVITENFNRAVCSELVKHIDPDGPDKTLVFCVNDRHADLFVRVLREAFVDYLGEVREAAIKKITGSVDRPLEMIRYFKNEPYPTIGVTVDLLTTGIDVPEITNLVFLRRVQSRILYEQMLGRATRLCPKIGKEVFRIYDAVDLYSALQHVTDMKPVATTRKVTFEQLAAELRALTDAGAREQVLGELLAKLARKKRYLEGETGAQFEQLAGMTPDALARALRAGTVDDAARFFADRPALAPFLDRKVGGDDRVLVSTHDDHVVDVSRGYGAGRTRPDDYLDSFAAFVKSHMNEIPALAVVTQRPRELTREQLKALKLALDAAGYDEPSLRTAWRQKSNVDIAASIIGYIRQAALGDPLVSYEDRVERALTRILGSRAWDVHQRKWLTRIAEQMKANTVVDPASLDRRPFANEGGFKRINKLFGGRLEEVLGEMTDEVWREGA